MHDSYESDKLADLRGLSREELEILALNVCPAADWYQLNDTIMDTSDEDLIKFIEENRYNEVRDI